MKTSTTAATGTFDVIVIGAGHAGCEAALASARIGCRTLLLTMNLDLVDQMPCNPSVGSSAKGQLVREMDALGGEMGRNIDRTFIQIRMLNLSKGPAVQALRAQVDKRLYALSIKHVIEATPNLYLKQGQVQEILVERDRVVGVKLARGQSFAAQAVIVASGTFLNGRVLCGEYETPAGRAGEPPAQGLSRCLQGLALELGRLQTDTPPRIDARTIDYTATIPQYGSETPLYFSFDGTPKHVWELPIHPAYPIEHQTSWRHQVPCYLVRSNERTHQIIRDNLHRSPITLGSVGPSGPRYCPSIEDKVVSFPDKDSHQLFLEPEGWATGEVYVQGLFTGMPVDVQIEMLHSIPALAEAEIMRPGYAIEYDFCLPHQLRPSLQVRHIPGLFLAGQINGTSGYEEAACQGLYAGINAARFVRDEEPLTLGRDEAFIGVLIDDLITKDIREPYRMMTSRAEHRMLLRQDNADLRLTPIAYRLGLATPEQAERVDRKRRAIEKELVRLETLYIRPLPEVQDYCETHGQPILRQPLSASQLLRRPGMGYDLVQSVAPPEESLAEDVIEQVEISLRYEGYINKQMRQAARAQRLEHWAIPHDINYHNIVGLRNEAREQLIWKQPGTVGQAARIRGVNPADISLLLVYLRRWHSVESSQDQRSTDRPAKCSSEPDARGNQSA